MSWTTDPGDAPSGDVEPTVHDDSTSVEAAPAVGEAVADSPVEDESSADVVTGETDAASPDDATVEDGAAEPVEPPREPDERLLAAHDLALSALREVTPDATIGAPAGYTLEDGGVVSLLFENQMSGYPGWFWTVTLARLEDEEPTVLELELLPGDDALLAPEWVPWAVRLADYQAAQAALREAGQVDADDEESDESDDDGLDLDDLDDLDAVDFDRDGSPILHAGDVDGVDIDELAESSELEDDADEGFDDDSDDDDSDVDDSDFVDDESDESDDSEDGESDEDDDESDEDDDESDEDDESDDSEESEDDAAHEFEFEIERDQN